MTGKELIINKGWQVIKFCDCIEQINTGLNPRQNFSLGKGNIKYITAKNLTAYGTIDFSKCDFVDDEAKRIIHRRSDIEIGDILFSSRAPIGHCHLIKEKPDYFDIGESIFSIRVNREIVSADYLCLYLMSDYFVESASYNTTGSIIKEIRIGDLMNTQIIVPPIPVQKKIAQCLEVIDRKLELNRQINDNLQRQIKLIYDYWFTQFDFPNENGKPYRSSGGKMVWNEKLKREIPEGWDVKELLSFCSWQSASQPPKSEFRYKPADGYVRFIQNRDYESDAKITFIPLKASTKLCNRYDIMVDKYGDKTAGTLRCGIDGAYNVALGKLTVNITELREYLRLYLSSDEMFNYLHNACLASTRSSLNETVFIGINVPIPTYQLRKRFEDYHKMILDGIFEIKKENQQLAALRDWLLSMLMNGQATISD